MNYLIYVYHYRNEDICVDTNPNLIYRGHTIDTNTWAKISVSKIKSENTLTMNAPPQTVNIKSCADGQWLFIHSNLLAKNEDKESFEKAAVIDVYDIKKGVYKFSFYLNNYDNKKLQYIW